jgi:hypothetical protein
MMKLGDNIVKSTLKKFQDELSTNLFGLTVSEATKNGICIECKEPALPKCYSDAGRKEYKISGMCEECYDKLFS